MSTSVKTSFEAIRGQPRIIPLYDTRVGSGDNAVYHIVGYAGVVITRWTSAATRRRSGSSRRSWCRTGDPATSDTDAVTEGVYMPPKLVIP